MYGILRPCGQSMWKALRGWQSVANAVQTNALPINTLCPCLYAQGTPSPQTLLPVGEGYVSPSAVRTWMKAGRDGRAPSGTERSGSTRGLASSPTPSSRPLPLNQPEASLACACCQRICHIKCLEGVAVKQLGQGQSWICSDACRDVSRVVAQTAAEGLMQVREIMGGGQEMSEVKSEMHWGGTVQSVIFVSM